MKCDHVITYQGLCAWNRVAWWSRCKAAWWCACSMQTMADRWWPYCNLCIYVIKQDYQVGRIDVNETQLDKFKHNQHNDCTIIRWSQRQYATCHVLNMLPGRYATKFSTSHHITFHSIPSLLSKWWKLSIIEKKPIVVIMITSSSVSLCLFCCHYTPGPLPASGKCIKQTA
jgi:hypothetical protein